MDNNLFSEHPIKQDEIYIKLLNKHFYSNVPVWSMTFSSQSFFKIKRKLDKVKWLMNNVRVYLDLIFSFEGTAIRQEENGYTDHDAGQTE